MNFLKRALDILIFSSAVLLAFLLVFDTYLNFPSLVIWIGRWHPLILHFPIVLIVITIIQYWRKDPYIFWFLSITTLLTLASAISGFLLSREMGAEGSLLQFHQWLGVLVAGTMAIWYWTSSGNLFSGRTIVVLQSLIVLLVVATGHYGGMITHGEDFLTLGSKEVEEIKALPNDPVVFEHVIQPIIDQKCVACHNSNKTKGKLLLTSFDALLQGGKSGLAIDQLQPENSLLHQRIHLPSENEEHMPPPNEEQLTEQELTLLSEWIFNGSDPAITFSELNDSSKSRTLIAALIEESNKYQWQDLPSVSQEQILDRSTSYISIMRRYDRSDALDVIMYPHVDYSTDDVESLKGIEKNIVSLNLSNLELSKKNMQRINSMENLELLDLSFTSLDETLFAELRPLPKLKELKINGTDLGSTSINQMTRFDALQKLYAFNTGIEEGDMNDEDVQQYQFQVVNVSLQAKQFKSVLPPPSIEDLQYFFRDPFKIYLHHPLEGINIHYTTDGETPTTSSPKSMDSILVTEDVELKYFASKEGWEDSEIDSVVIINAGPMPDDYELVHVPNPKYVGRGDRLLFDLDKGPDNFGDSAWMAYIDHSFILNCSWDDPQDLSKVILSTLVNTDPSIFPPEEIIVRGGASKGEMKVLSVLRPKRLKERYYSPSDYIKCEFEQTTLKFLQIEVKPLRKIPNWHQQKGKGGWFFIDEVIIG